MNIYYIDYENVSSQGLKGIELLTGEDEVILLYSKKADNVKIDTLTMMMESKARIRFMPVHVGTPNALDFQLVTLLFLNYRDEDYCYIISKDSGYDCCIKTAAENGAVHVARYPNIESAVNKLPVKKTRRGSRAKDQAESPAQVQAAEQPKQNLSPDLSGAGQEQENAPVRSTSEDPSVTLPDARKETAPQPAALQSDSASQAASAEDGTKKKSSRRRGRKKSSSTETEQKNPVPVTGIKLQNTNTGMKNQSANSGAKNQPSSSSVKIDPDKPVSILSVVRRRNDVQLDMHQIDLIRDALKNAGNKQQFYNYFVKKLGQKQGIELYHSIKSSYTDLVNANLI